MDTLRYMLLTPMLVTAYLAGKQKLGRDPRLLTSTSAIVLAFVAIPTLLQVAIPDLYGWLASVPARVVDSHQYWRLLTAVTVQDGGIIGAAFNLVALFFTLRIAEPVLGKWRVVTVFLAGAVGLNLIATIFGVETAGNSGATFFLIAAVAGYSLSGVRSLKRNWAAFTCIGIAIALAALRDAHGYAFIAGVVVGLLLKSGMLIKKLSQGSGH